MRNFLACLALLVVATPFATADNSLQDALNHQYKNHIYNLRAARTAPAQQYDSLGNSQTASLLGPWTTHGRLLIKKIKLDPNRLIVEGQRSGVEFDTKKGIAVAVKLDQQVKLEIALNQPLDSAGQARIVLSHVFAFKKEDFIASAAPLWQKYLTDHLDAYADDGQQMTFRAQAPGGSKKVELSGVEILHVGNGVAAPKPTYVPDPDYSEVARARRFQGTTVVDVIVGPDGRVHNVRLTRPIGLGLDELSVAKIMTWKFEPAMRDGKPVAVEVSVEVQFRLY